MFANKENLVLQAPITSKANPKTPAPGKSSLKTPFKVPLNDENVIGVVNLKTGKKGFLAGRDASSFITPVGPRRPALAGKTTNAKTKARAPADESAKIEKSKIAGLRSLSASLEESEEIPEIEYMPPVPVVGYVDDIQDLPNLDSLLNTYMNGCYRAYISGLDEDGKTELQREMEKNFRRLEADLDAESEDIINKIKGIGEPKSISSGPNTVKPSENVVSRTRHEEDRAARGTKETASTFSRANSIIRPAALPVTRPTASSAARSASSSNRPPSNFRPTQGASGSRSSSSASIPRPNSATPRRVNTMDSNMDSKRAAELLLQRPSSAASITHPQSQSHGHSRSASTYTAVSRRPLPSSANKNASAKISHSRTRSRSPSSAGAIAASRTTIGYNSGREVRDAVKKEVSRFKLESALDAIERIQREDEEKFGPLDGGYPTPIFEFDEDVIAELPSPLMSDDEFFMIMPGESE